MQPEKKDKYTAVDYLLDVFKFVLFACIVFILFIFSFQVGISLSPFTLIPLYVYLTLMLFSYSVMEKDSRFKLFGVRAQNLYKFGAWVVFVEMMLIIGVLTTSPVSNWCPTSEYGGGDYVLEYYYSPMCMYCQIDRLNFHSELIAQKEFKVEKYDIRSCGKKSRQRNVLGIPTYVWVKDNQTVLTHTGPYVNLENVMEDFRRLRDDS